MCSVVVWVFNLVWWAWETCGLHVVVVVFRIRIQMRGLVLMSSFAGVSLRTRPTVHFPSACVVLVSYSRFIGVFLFFFFLSLFFDIESWMLGGFKGGYPVALP